MNPFSYTRANAAAQAAQKKNADTQFIAGGTNLVDLMKKYIATPDALIDVSEALNTEIKAGKEGVRIGAMVRNSALAEHAAIKKDYPLLSKAILAGASPQIRHMASTGGNLLQRTRCPYFYDTSLPCNKREPGTGCGALDGDNSMSAIVGWSQQCVAVFPSDMCVALAALNATVVVNAHKKQANIPFKDFHRLPGTTPQQDNNLPANAIIEFVDIAANPFNKNSAYVKLRERSSYAFALVSVAAALHLNGNTITEARLASGGVAHKPWRWFEAENFLKGKEASAANFRQAAQMAAATARPLKHNAYKVELLKGAIETALLQAHSA